MFFVKVAFWALLIMVLLPSNTQEKLEFYGTAQRSVSDVSEFCVRNAEVCDKTVAFFSSIYQKLVTTTEMVEEMLMNSGIGGDVRGLQREDPYGETYPQDTRRPRPQRQGKGDNLSRAWPTSSMSQNTSQNTLTRQDLEPSWQGPGRHASFGRQYR